MRTPHLIGLLGVLSLAGVASFAIAQDKSDHPRADAAKAKLEAKKEELKEKRDDLKDKRDDKQEERRDARAARDADDPDLKDLKEEWKKKHADWVEKRKDRRDEVKAKLKEKYGDELKVPAARAELKVHARRVARLERIIFLAQATEKKAVEDKANALLKKENERHDKRMTALAAEVKK